MATSPIAVKFHLENIIEHINEKYIVIVVTNLSEDSHRYLKNFSKEVRFFDSKMKRKISIIHDIRTLILLFRFFRNEKISMFFSITPKAGLLGSLASFFMRVPIRVHTFTGQVWQTKKGFYKRLLMFLDRLIYLLCTKVLVDSPSQRQFLIENRIISFKDSLVLGNGSFCGVDINRFLPNRDSRTNIRKMMRVSDTDIIFLFVGRFDIDKGIIELIKAFSLLLDEIKNISLWLLGPSDNANKYLDELITIKESEKIKILPYSQSPEKYMAAADIFCLPSYREGFGTVIIESAASGIPSIGTNIHGLIDSIVDGKTGLLVDPGDIKSLSESMFKLASNQELRIKMGRAARSRAKELYSQDLVVPRLGHFIDNELQNLDI